MMLTALLRSFTSIKMLYKTEVNNRFQQPISEANIITEADLQKVPEPVAKYLRYCGWLNKEKPMNFYCKFDGPFFLKPGKPTKFSIEQYSWLDKPTRIFRMNNWMISGRHHMDHRGAFMLIKLFGRIKLVNAFGPEMNQAELVTYLNDMCILAPGALIDAPILWEEIDSHTVKATISFLGDTISALLYFNEIGELENFTSNDRYYTMNGKKAQNIPWSTPMYNYIESCGYKRPSYGEAIWDFPSGKFCYARFSIKEVQYNIAKPKFQNMF